MLTGPSDQHHKSVFCRLPFRPFFFPLPEFPSNDVVGYHLPLDSRRIITVANEPQALKNASHSVVRSQSGLLTACRPTQKRRMLTTYGGWEQHALLVIPHVTRLDRTYNGNC
jgi:hypothetical protein